MKNIEYPVVILKTKEGKQIVLLFEKGKVRFENEKIEFIGNVNERILLREVI